MKKFEIPDHYKSPIISKVKAMRKTSDPLKRDLSPTLLNFGKVTFIIPRHFGFCYGVENAIEKSYKAITENPGKRIFLISQMIHNPEVNDDLMDQGVRFIQDTNGEQLIPWTEIKKDDIVIVPAFGQTVETEKILQEIQVDYHKYDTTCPFVEKVWNRSAKLGEKEYTVIIHGKHKHEETKATFSHSKEAAHSLIVKDLNEAKILANYIAGEMDKDQFLTFFEGKLSSGFDPDIHLNRFGVVNQTTMLASETQEIAEVLKNAMIKKFGESQLKNHFADTRDTLCYATNDNQSATLELLNQEADFAVVVGGYNSSNTSHLVELLETKFPTYFIQNNQSIESSASIASYDIHRGEISAHDAFLPKKDHLKIIITSGASCPDATVDGVIQKLLYLIDPEINLNSYPN